MPGRDCRIVAVRRAAEHPQVLATDMHLTLGGVELSDVKWDEAACTLSGVARRAPGAKGRIFLRLPEGWSIATGAAAKTRDIAIAELEFSGKDAAWVVRFRKSH